MFVLGESQNLLVLLREQGGMILSLTTSHALMLRPYILLKRVKMCFMLLAMMSMG